MKFWSRIVYRVLRKNRYSPIQAWRWSRNIVEGSRRDPSGVVF